MIPISKEEFEDRLAHPANILRPTIQKNGSYQLKNRAGDNHQKVPNECRPLVAAVAMLAGNKAAAQVFGISHQRAGEIKDGEDRNGKPIPEEVKKVEAVREALGNRALERLTASLGLITDERLDKLPTADLVAATKDLSIVVKNVVGEANPGSRAGNAQVIIFAPNQRDARSYDALEVEATPVR